MTKHLNRLEAEVKVATWPTISIHPPPLWRQGIPLRERRSRTRALPMNGYDQISPHIASRRNRRTIVAVFEIKKRRFGI
jgi:hypothetical protein